MDTRKDTQLIADYMNGDEQSLEVLIGRYLDNVYYFVYRYVGDKQEAEDVTQEVFVRAWKNLKNFDSQKSFKTWIFTIAKNAALDTLKKKKTLNFSVFENENGENALFETLMDDALRIDAISEQKGIAVTLTKAIEFLSPAYQTVLSLRYHDDLTFATISEVLREHLNTVKSRHRRGLILLKDILKKSDFF